MTAGWKCSKAGWECSFLECAVVQRRFLCDQNRLSCANTGWCAAGRKRIYLFIYLFLPTKWAKRILEWKRGNWKSDSQCWGEKNPSILRKHDWTVREQKGKRKTTCGHFKIKARWSKAALLCSEPAVWRRCETANSLFSMHRTAAGLEELLSAGDIMEHAASRWLEFCYAAERPNHTCAGNDYLHVSCGAITGFSINSDLLTSRHR